MNIDLILNRYVNDTIFGDQTGYPKQNVSNDVQDLVETIVSLRAENGRQTAELERWQQEIYELCQKHKPDVDGAGSDGDELDLTLSEINEVFIMYQDKIDEMKESFDWLAKRVKKLPTWVEENSYAAQVDMRERAYDLVVFAQAGKYTKGEEAQQ